MNDDRWSAWRERTHDVVYRIGTGVFGDRIGLAVFLGALVFFSLFWRIGFFITDNWTIANTLVNVADGHLHVDLIVYGPESGLTPGMHVVDGRLYGRNYGHVFLALPVLFALEVAVRLVDLRIAIAGATSLGLLAFAVQVGRLVDQRTAFAAIGGAGALGMFALNVALARPLDAMWLAMIALQVTTMLAGALTGVVVYRLVRRIHGRRLGAFAGAVTVLATPVAFWASIPKRHVLTGCLAAIALFGFAAGRRTDAGGSELRYRALTYGAVGLTAWIHAAEGLVLFAVVVAFDLLTAERRDRRALAVLGLVFAIALVPFLATNVAIAGNPTEPPRLLPSYTGGADVALDTPAPAVGGEPTDGDAGGVTPRTPPDGGTTPEGETRTPRSGGPARDRPSSPGARAAVRSIVGAVRTVAVGTAGVVATGVRAVPGRFAEFESHLARGSGRIVQPTPVYHTFVRSGGLGLRRADAAINLTLVESMPLLGLLVAALASVHRLRWRGVRVARWSPSRQADAFAVGYVVVFTLLYAPRLPIHAQATVRYLVPLVPALVYLTVRVPAVRRVVDANGGPLLWAYAGSVLLGGQGVVVAMALADLTLGPAMQFLALLGLTSAGIAAVWALVDTAVWPLPRAGVVALAIPAAQGTLFVLLSAFEYFAYGEFALGVSRVLSQVLPLT